MKYFLFHILMGPVIQSSYHYLPSTVKLKNLQPLVHSLSTSSTSIRHAHTHKDDLEPNIYSYIIMSQRLVVSNRVIIRGNRGSTPRFCLNTTAQANPPRSWIKDSPLKRRIHFQAYGRRLWLGYVESCTGSSDECWAGLPRRVIEKEWLAALL